MAVAIKNRLNEITERKLEAYQCAFRKKKNRLVIEQVFYIEANHQIILFCNGKFGNKGKTH